MWVRLDTITIMAQTDYSEPNDPNRVSITLRMTGSRRFGDMRASVVYLSRLVRAVALRLFLRLCLTLFSLEEKFHPVRIGPEKRILIMVVGGMGDCLLFDSLFRRLKEEWQESRIDVVTMGFLDMWKRIESVDNLIFVSPAKIKGPWSYARLFRTIYRSRYDIAAEGLAMVPKGGIFPIFSSLILEASRAPVRIGRRTVGRNILLHPRAPRILFHKVSSDVWGTDNVQAKATEHSYVTHTIRLDPPDKRTNHESSQVFAPLGIDNLQKNAQPILSADLELDRWAKRRLRDQWATKDDIIVGFTTETTKSIKSWAPENFCSVLEWGIERHLKFVMLGLTPQPGNSLFMRFPEDHFLDLSGKTSLAEMIAIIRQCDLFLSCDTGPAHIAQACRVPTIVLFGPSNEKEFGPVDHDLHTLIMPPGHFNCRPCVLGPCVKAIPCVQEISPEVVHEALMRGVNRLLVPQKPSLHMGDPKSPRVLCLI